MIVGEIRSRNQQNCHVGLLEGRFCPVNSLVDSFTQEEVLKGKAVQKAWTFFKKGILKVQEQAVPHVLKDDPVWKKAGLAEQRLLAGIWCIKKGVYGLCEEGQANQQYYKDVMRLCGEKIKSSKAQIELQLLLQRTIKKKSYKFTISKRRV